MKEVLQLLQSKIKSITFGEAKCSKTSPFNECSKTIVTATSADSEGTPGLKMGTSLPIPPWEGIEFVRDRPIHEDDVIHLQLLIELIKDVHQCQNEQFTFFQKYSEYLQMDRQVFPNRLCLFAPPEIIKEQQDLLDREKALNLKFEKKKHFKSSFWRRFRWVRFLVPGTRAEWLSVETSPLFLGPGRTLWAVASFHP